MKKKTNLNFQTIIQTWMILEYDIGDAYIEHDSLDLLNGIIEDEDKLKNLLFVKESEIVIENDNHFFQVAGGNEKRSSKTNPQFTDSDVAKIQAFHD